MALTTRAVHAVSEAGLLPKSLAKTGKSGSPIPAAVLTALLSGAVSCFPQFTSLIVNYGALFATITIVVNCVSLICARQKDKAAGGASALSFHAPFGSALPVITMIVLVICYIPSIRTGGWQIWVYTLASYCVGFTIFAIMRRRRRG
jgi:APA family basic amino acid/polyamine antiporter